jgi:3-oxoacyl-[acyl-carrier-protein] synthase II
MARVERRVVVTGIGLVTPLGIGTQQTWEAAIAGKSGVGPITRFDAKDLPARIAGEVKGFDPAAFMDKKEARRNDLFIQFGLAAAQLALQDSGLPTDKPLGERCGVIVGSGMGGLATLEDTHLTAVNKGHRRVNPFFIPSIIVNLVGGQISIRYGAAGVNYAPVSACATGNHAIGESMRHIQHGDADVIISGGAEATITLLGISASATTRPRRPRGRSTRTATDSSPGRAPAS